MRGDSSPKVCETTVRVTKEKEKKNVSQAGLILRQINISRVYQLVVSRYVDCWNKEIATRKRQEQ